MDGSRKPIVVVGSINMDLVAHAHRIPVPGESFVGTSFDTTPGGKGANQAVAAARLGYPTHIIGAVGEDVFGQALLDNLAAAGVETAAVQRVPGPSGVAPILIADSGENAIVVVPGANGKVDSDAVDRYADLIRSAGMVFCQLELPIPTVSRTLALCAAAGVPVMLDPAPAATLPDEIWSQVAWFTPNETEAAFYLGEAAQPRGRCEAPALPRTEGSCSQARRRRLLCSCRWGPGSLGSCIQGRRDRHCRRRRLLQRRVCRWVARRPGPMGRNSLCQCRRGHLRYPSRSAGLHAFKNRS